MSPCYKFFLADLLETTPSLTVLTTRLSFSEIRCWLSKFLQKGLKAAYFYSLSNFSPYNKADLRKATTGEATFLSSS